MNKRATREDVLLIFERFRAIPGAPFYESHFMDFLLAKPKDNGAVKNSFIGLKRFNAFIDEVQYEYGVCFSLEDRESNSSLDTFVERIIRLQQSRRGSLKSLKNQERAGAGWQLIVLLNAILLGAAYGLRSVSWVAALLVLISIATTVAFAVFVYRARLYLRRLRSRIENAEDRNDAV
jgi:hypothetical protein